MSVITFDETKRQANIAAHRVDIATLTSFFDGDIMTREDTRVTCGESRFQSVGWYDGEMLFVVWTPRDDDWPHLISARKAERHEREAWTRYFG